MSLQCLYFISPLFPLRVPFQVLFSPVLVSHFIFLFFPVFFSFPFPLSILEFLSWDSFFFFPSDFFPPAFFPGFLPQFFSPLPDFSVRGQSAPTTYWLRLWEAVLWFKKKKKKKVFVNSFCSADWESKGPLSRWWWYWEVPSMQMRIMTFIPLLSTLLDVR